MSRLAVRPILGQALNQRRGRWLALAAGAAYLLLYLYSLGHLVIDRQVVAPGDTPRLVIVPEWTTKSLERIGGFSFEPVAALYLAQGLTLFIAPVNLLIGAILGTLIALNVAAAAYALTVARSCRRLPWTDLLGLAWTLRRVRRELGEGGVSLPAIASGHPGMERRSGHEGTDRSTKTKEHRVVEGSATGTVPGREVAR